MAIVDSNDPDIIYYETTADNQGNYVINGVNETGGKRSYMVYAYHESYIEGYSQSFLIEPNMVFWVRVVLTPNTPPPTPTGTVTGQVTTHNNIGIPYASVAIVSAYDTNHKFYETTADGNGFFEFPCVNATGSQLSYKLYAQHGSYGEGYSYAIAVHEGYTTNTNVVILTLPANIALSADNQNIQADGTSTATITAYVTDSMGNPVIDGYTITFSQTNTSAGAGLLAPVSSSSPDGSTVTATTRNGYASVKFGWATVEATNTIRAEINSLSARVDIHITL
ncbi:hypothetical protein CUJ83_11065 [Methanocella sp. CWC-04]|uniref:Big-1 domain-containing protein n=1 Tax=Methanooceanicella nereidis TaxID=2052831 RepID=A0AAP2RDX2_9EURY|nr:hypothetical protein [Methanocella sp. CWC-04]